MLRRDKNRATNRPVAPEGRICWYSFKFRQFSGVYSHISAPIKVKFGNGERTIPTVLSPMPNFAYIGCHSFIHSYSFNVEVDITQLQTDREARKEDIIIYIGPYVAVSRPIIINQIVMYSYFLHRRLWSRTKA